MKFYSLSIKSLDSGEPELVVQEHNGADRFDDDFAELAKDTLDLGRSRITFYPSPEYVAVAFGRLRRAVLERIDKDIAKAQHERNMIANLSPPKV